MGINSSDENSHFIYDDDNFSYYYGFKSKNSEDDFYTKEENKNYLEDDIITQRDESNINNTEKKIMIPVTFEWDKGGNNVYLTGSFCNWKQFFLMKKEKNGKYILNLNLPKGIYQYKFKIDEEWKYNDKYPIYKENGIINNILDITNSENTIKNLEDKTTTAGISSNTENNEFSKISKKSLAKSKNSSYLKQKIYSNYIPNRDELKENIPELPIQYKSCININLYSNQNKIGNKKFIFIREKNILSDNISFKNIGIIYHDQVNHLNLNNKQFNKQFISNNNKYKNIITSVSSRYRDKYTTFVYYKPNK